MVRPVQCESCGRRYDADALDACPGCGVNGPIGLDATAALAGRRTRPVTCENCGGRYDAAQDPECPVCAGNQPLEERFDASPEP